MLNDQFGNHAVQALFKFGDETVKRKLYTFIIQNSDVFELLNNNEDGFKILN